MDTGTTSLKRSTGRFNSTLDLRSTLDSIVDAAAELVPCVLVEISLWDAEEQRLTREAFHSKQEFTFPDEESDPTGRGYADWLVHHKQPLLVPDLTTQKDDPSEQLGGEVESPSKAYLGLPLLAGDELIGTLVLIHHRAGAFGYQDVERLQDLAADAAMAVRNAALYEKLTRSHRELAALNSVAATSNQALDLKTLMPDALERVIECLGGDAGGIRLVDPVDQKLVLSFIQGMSDDYLAAVGSLSLGEGIVGNIALTGEPALLADLSEDPRLKPGVLSELKKEGFRSFAVVPLGSREEIVGTLGVASRKRGVFGPGDIDLLTAMGHQIGVAIANAQLFEETQQKARDLAALNAVASIVNQPLGLQEIIDQALEKVMAAVGTDVAEIQLYDQLTHNVLITSVVANRGEDLRLMERIRLEKIIPGGLAQFGDPFVTEDSGFGHSTDTALPTCGTIACIPMMIGEKTVGILGVYSRSCHEFTADELDLLVTMGRQLGTAAERARLARDLKQRARELEAAHAVAATVNRPGQLTEILGEGLRQALAVTGLEMGSIFVWDSEAEELRLNCHQGMSPSFAEWIQRHVAGKSPDIWSLVEDWSEEERIDIEEISLDSDELPDELRAEAIRLTADVPLFAEGAVVGVLTVATRSAHLFTPEEQSVLQAIGHQLGTAIANTQLRQDALNSERLAALGRVAAGVAHDLRSPLGSIMRSAEFLARPELSQLTRQRLSSAIVAMARRLINTSQELLDYARGGQMALHRIPRSLPTFLEEVLEVLRVDLSDRGIAVETDWGYTGPVAIDSDRMAQAVYNIAANARDAMPNGGRLTIATKRVRDTVELRFADTGPGIPADLVERVFEPFVSHGKEEGAGLGLAIAQRIVQEHGGDIELESPPGAGATFTIRLPLD